MAVDHTKMLAQPKLPTHLLLLLLFMSQPLDVFAGGSKPPPPTNMTDFDPFSLVPVPSQSITIVSPPPGAVFLAGLPLPVLWTQNYIPLPSPGLVNDTRTNKNASNTLDSPFTPIDKAALASTALHNFTTPNTNVTLDFFIADSSRDVDLVPLEKALNADTGIWIFDVPRKQNFSKWYYVVIHLHGGPSAEGGNNITVVTVGPFTILDREADYFFLTGPDPATGCGSACKQWFQGGTPVMGVANKPFVLTWYSEVPGLQTVDITLNATAAGGPNVVLAHGVNINLGKYTITPDMDGGGGRVDWRWANDMMQPLMCDHMIRIPAEDWSQSTATCSPKKPSLFPAPLGDQSPKLCQPKATEKKKTLTKTLPIITLMASHVPDTDATVPNGYSHDVVETFKAKWEQDTTDLPRLQVIDEEKKFTEEMPDYMKTWGLGEAGFNYNVVAVFGSQSTGKSTLLNRLFGTSFDIMSEVQRKQTTKGIWMSRGRGMHVLIMDVEGTDGRERGEDQDFERKSALFSIATSEVIILNLWEHQVGLYQGANMGLLKTVFEVNLQLFQAHKGNEKTLLLFVIRDFVGATPLVNLSNTLQADLDKIWVGLSKPEGLEDCKITDYFDFMYTALPHKILVPEKFDDEVSKLRLRFIDPQHPNFVFQPHYHKRVPADGLHIYAGGIWDKIQSNKDLDLPTQQELLAQYRCDEIANVALAAFTAKFIQYKRPIESGSVIENLGPEMLEARNVAIKAFDKDASRYHAEVYKRKRLELLAKANTFLQTYYLGQLKNLHKKASGLFKDTLTQNIKSPNYDFLTAVQSARMAGDEYFLAGAKAILLPETDWTYEDEHAQLEADYEEVASKARADEVRKMEKSLEKMVQLEVNEPLSLLLNNANPGAWHKVVLIFHKAMDKGKETLIKQAKTAEEENRRGDGGFKVVVEAKEQVKLYDPIYCVMSICVLDASHKFHMCHQFGNPTHCLFSHNQALKLLPLFGNIDLSEDTDFVISSDDVCILFSLSYDFDFEASLTILSESKQADLTQRFKRESDAFYLEAKRSTVATTAKIPYWLLVLLAVLGWNEAISIITSPLYLTLFVVFGFFGYIIYLLNLWGPIERMLRVALNEAYNMGKEKLLEGVDKAKEQGIEMKAFGGSSGSLKQHSN
ncbi:root hair defective 3 GTP-binding protein-domain-containing protein [Jimgerdemannia flammicorona]|uniref:Root hair defective 3 GTP-binding protein-domain-containing protein n=1 Tax=Jimgerdemannia flammicorona TaxID=994334 RepID=A0A433QPZ6_9FUNG|nr:root hair defective 3 GTP-binding protein-domain-containing protein [Jimgerdemannia flammicorona]